MTVSLDFNEIYDDPYGDIQAYSAALGATSQATGIQGPSVYDYVRGLSPDTTRSHGQVFEFQTPQTDVLNWAVSRLLKQDFIEALENRIWSKMGAGEDAYVLLDAFTNCCAGGGLNATARDLARFASVMLSDGKSGDTQIIPKSAIDTLTRGSSTKVFLKGSCAEEEMANGYWSYCAQWWIRNTPGSNAMIAMGISGQWIYIDRNRGVAVIKQSSQPKVNRWYDDTFTLNAMDAVVRCVAGK